MEDLRILLASVRTYLETDRMAGIDEFVSSAGIKDIVNTADTPSRALMLEELRKKAELCKGCMLCRKRTNLVFGSGNPSATLMFIGEAPGADEDLKGLPFVGRAGELLTKMIEAIGMRREDVYIANVLKCRPPGNRPPQPEEIAACSPHLQEQIRVIAPRVICTLGKFASQFVLTTEEPISALRGKFREIDAVRVMPTYHPAYLLRDSAQKRVVWEDLKKIRDVLKEP
ncbi:MAG: uracil-DNA glycosylase [Candidatus Omnitrophota bacterium]